MATTNETLPKDQLVTPAIVTTTDTCSSCGAKLTNAETARLNWQNEAHRLEMENKVIRAQLSEMTLSCSRGDRNFQAIAAERDALRAQVESLRGWADRVCEFIGRNPVNPLNDWLDKRNEMIEEMKRL